MQINIDNIYTFSNFKTKCIYNNPQFIDGDKYLLELYKDDVILTDTNKEICIVIDKNLLKLEYIGIKENLRGGVLKQLHKNCYEILKTTYIENIVLKPLSTVLTMWIYLGFNFIKPMELIRAKLTLINYLKSKNIIDDSSISKYDEMEIQEIVILHKEIFKEKEFPKLVEKELYYTNLSKDIK